MKFHEFFYLPTAFLILCLFSFNGYRFLHVEMFFNVMIFVNYIRKLGHTQEGGFISMWIYHYVLRWHKLHSMATIWEHKLCPNFPAF